MNAVAPATDFAFPRAFEPIVRRAARYKAVHGGRGSSKSWSFAQLALLRCMQGQRIICIREVQKTLADSAQALLKDQIKRLKLLGFRVIRDKIYHASGGEISFLGMNDHTADNIKSFEGADVAWFMEAQNCSQESLNVLRPTIRKPGSEIWFEWNPRNAGDPVDAFFRGPNGAPKSAIVIQMNHSDNPWFPDVLAEDMLEDFKNDKDLAEHVWNGAYRTGAGGFFSGIYNPKAHRMEPFNVPENWRIDRSHDWGSAKPHATSWFAMSNGEAIEFEPGIEFAFPAGTLFAIEEHYGTAGDHIRGYDIGTRETDQEIADAIAGIDEQLEKRFNTKVRPGPADGMIFNGKPGTRTTAQIYQSRGVRFVEAFQQAGSRVSGCKAMIDMLKEGLRFHQEGRMEGPGLFFWNTCFHLDRVIREIQTDPNEPDAYDTSKEDHNMDAVRYRVYQRAPGKTKSSEMT